MIIYKCDLNGCGVSSPTPMPIELRGYYPGRAGGILIPDHLRLHQFCSHECFVKWLKWAMALERDAT